MIGSMTCSVCNTPLTPDDAYDYRGVVACADHIDAATERRDAERAEIIEEERAKTEPLRGLDMADNPVGRANRDLLKSRIEIASKESGRLRAYER